MREPNLKKGLPTCDASQVTTKEGDETCAGRNSANNAWYVNTSNGNRNNNNTYNRYGVVGASEFVKNGREWLYAEKCAYKHKHHNFGAARIHYHLPELYAFVDDSYRYGYRPRPMSAFVLTYPVFREAFAPHELDCIVDHYCAPLFTAVAEGLHEYNGDISHGNRIGHSAQGMAERIRDDIRIVSNGGTKRCIHAHVDIEGFFMNINRMTAYKIVEKYSEEYYPFPDRDEKLSFLKAIILNDPVKDCVFRAPRGAWKHIARNKTLFKAKPGFGLPIGKYPSQVVAGIVLAIVDSALVGIRGIREEHFVDDYDIIAPDAAKMAEAISLVGAVLAKLELRLHPKKRSAQPAHRGMLSCGRIVKGDRIYIGNRTVRECRKRVRLSQVDYSSAFEMRQSINSVFGLMGHCNAYRIQQEIAGEVLSKFGRWMYFKAKPNRLVCVIKKRYTRQYRAKQEIIQIIKQHETWENQRRSRRTHRGRGRKGTGRSTH